MIDVNIEGKKKKKKRENYFKNRKLVRFLKTELYSTFVVRTLFGASNVWFTIFKFYYFLVILMHYYPVYALCIIHPVLLKQWQNSC